MKEKRTSFEAACAQFVHRFTMEHVPAWSQKPTPNGKFCRPQWRTDLDWYNAHLFPGDRWQGHKLHGNTASCEPIAPSQWPLGKELQDTPYKIER